MPYKARARFVRAENGMPLNFAVRSRKSVHETLWDDLFNPPRFLDKNFLI